MSIIDKLFPKTGRMFKENGQTINLANFIEEIHKALVLDRNTTITPKESNISQDYLTNTVVTAGAIMPVLANVEIDGNEVGLSIRLAAAKKFKMSIVPKTMSGLNSDVDIILVDKSTTAIDRGSGRAKLVARKNNIYISNVDSTDLTIQALNITTFKN